MKWVVANGWRKDNPADAIAQALPKHTGIKQHRKALHYSEVATCIAAVKKSNASDAAKLALEFLILTAARSGEVRGATWLEICDYPPAKPANSAKQPSWELPPERMKAKRLHRVPLAGRAVELLDKAAQQSCADGYIFQGMKAGKPLSDMTLSKLVKELGFDCDVHGFRTSFRMWAQEQTNFPREVAEAALAHTIKNKAEAAYARSDLFEKRRMMMEAWASYLDCETGKVVRLA